MSNFTFLTTNWPDLYDTAHEAEQNVNSAPPDRLRLRSATEEYLSFPGTCGEVAL